ncbi:hypothetical protein K439DRAFT_447619 [Ramaria rubella]|nr:hypothetical protein K439DRAFT_447619 [Ramaria rubella]
MLQTGAAQGRHELLLMPCFTGSPTLHKRNVPLKSDAAAVLRMLRLQAAELFGKFSTCLPLLTLHVCTGASHGQLPIASSLSPQTLSLDGVPPNENMTRLSHGFGLPAAGLTGKSEFSIFTPCVCTNIRHGLLSMASS